MRDCNLFGILGNGVVSQMDKTICDVVRVVVASWETEVGLLIKPDCQRVPICDKDPLADVVFTFLDNLSIFDVFLSDKLRLFLLA